MTVRRFLLPAATAAVLFGCLGGPTHAQAPAAVPTAAAAASVRALFDAEADDTAFRAALEKARSAGAPPQVLVEARLVRAVRQDDGEALAALVPEMETASAGYNPAISPVFRNASDFSGFLHLARALAARSKGDAAVFEREVKEAFWTAPEQAEVFGNFVSRYRREQRLSQITVPLDVPLTGASGRSTTLAQVLGDKKAILIDFWASWCGPCMELMDELKAKGAKLGPQGIVVAGLNTESDPAKAKAVQKARGITLPWLIEPEALPYSKLLEVSTIPQMVLLSPDGKVLFAGHPQEPGLKAALQKLGVTL